MNNLRNQVHLIGHVGNDVEVKEVKNGQLIAKASLATKHVYKNKKGEKVIETQWHRIVGWGKNATLMESLMKKGKEVAIRGKLVNNRFKGKDGKVRQLSQIVVQEFLLVS